jgi:hypothetical protein
MNIAGFGLSIVLLALFSAPAWGQSQIQKVIFDTEHGYTDGDLLTHAMWQGSSESFTVETAQAAAHWNTTKNLAMAINQQPVTMPADSSACVSMTFNLAAKCSGSNNLYLPGINLGTSNQTFPAYAMGARLIYRASDGQYTFVFSNFNGGVIEGPREVAIPSLPPSSHALRMTLQITKPQNHNTPWQIKTSLWDITQNVELASVSPTAIQVSSFFNEPLYASFRSPNANAADQLTVKSFASYINPRSSNGALNVPWETYYAADGTTDGQIVSGQGDHTQLPAQAVTRRAVILSQPNQSIEWTVRAPANAIVLRHQIPGNNGFGQRTISLQVNHVTRQQLLLGPSAAALAADGDKKLEGLLQFFDETRAFIQGDSLQPGDVVTLVRDGDQSQWDNAQCAIDLIDLEHVAPPVAMPSGFISITDFGAVADGQTDCTAAIEECIAASLNGNAKVWIPQGTFITTRPITVTNATIMGAGPWHSVLFTPVLPRESNNFKSTYGLKLVGDCTVKDLMIQSVQYRRVSIPGRGLDGNPSNFLIDNVWISHTQTGPWLKEAINGTIQNCRIRCTCADGMNLHDKSHDVLIQNNTTRGTGDDGLAIWSTTTNSGADGPCYNITMRNNTVDAPWNANGLAVYGGTNITVKNNRVRSTARDSGLTVTTGYHSWPVSQVTISNNDLLDCGGTHWKQEWGGIFIYVPERDIQSLLITDNLIINPSYTGIKFQRVADKGAMHVQVKGNVTATPGRQAYLLRPNLLGTITIMDNLEFMSQPNDTVLTNLSSADILELVTDIDY